MWKSLRSWFASRNVHANPPLAEVEKPKAPLAFPKIGPEVLARSRVKPEAAKAKPFAVALHPREATPKVSMAQDAELSGPLAWATASFEQSAIAGAFIEGQQFLGYPVLSFMAQRPEYRRMNETIATHMTRRWIKLESTGGDDKTERLEQLKKEMERLKVKEAFYEAALGDGFFGRSHIYVDLGDIQNRDEQKMPIGDGRNAISKNKIGVGSLKRLTPVEAVWCYPSNYNSNDPLAPDWYKPQLWYAQGREVHASRLLTFVGREVPDLLKPAYSFGGLSLTQMAKPYVDNWLRTRQSVSDLVEAFSVMVLKTNLPLQLNANNGQDLFDRLDLFNNLRNNRGVMAVDKTQEELTNVSAPLGSLDALQAQSQEHMASVNGIPLIFLLGITPSGLNASSEEEIEAFYDEIHARQELVFRPNLTRLLGIIQLSLWGEVDPSITFSFEPLRSLDDGEKTDRRLKQAQTDDVYVTMGALDPAEVRKGLATDPDSRYQIDLTKELLPRVPTPPELAGEKLNGAGGPPEPPEPKTPPAANPAAVQ